MDKTSPLRRRMARLKMKSFRGRHLGPMIKLGVGHGSFTIIDVGFIPNQLDSSIKFNPYIIYFV